MSIKEHNELIKDQWWYMKEKKPNEISLFPTSTRQGLFDFYVTFSYIHTNKLRPLTMNTMLWSYCSELNLRTMHGM